MGWEIGNSRQLMPFLTDIIDRISNFEVFNKEKFIQDGPSHDQICFVWVALNMGAHWRDVSENKTPREFEDFISKLDFN